MKEGDIPSLPKGWEMKTLGEIGKVSMCKRILKKQTNEIGGIPFYKIGTFGKEANAYISKEIYEEFKSKYSFPKKGDILLSASGTIGRRVIYDGRPAYFQDSNIVWIDNNEKEVLNEYLYKFYGYCDWNPSRGATISRLYNDDLRRIPLPIPPLPEQKQIVTILDKAFAAIDQAQANIEKNIENAKELFQSKLNDIFSQKGEGWEEKKLGEITHIQRGSSPRPKGDPKYFSNEPTDFNWITIKDISSYCEDNILLKTNEWLTEEGSKKSRYVDENDFIIAVSGSTTGKCCLTGIKGFIYDGLAVVKSIDNIIEHKFLLHYMMSKYSVINNSKAGAAFPNINTNYLNNLPIAYPSIEQQKSLVSLIEELQSETQGLEHVYQNKFDSLVDLKKSLLQKAFSGELTSASSVTAGKSIEKTI